MPSEKEFKKIIPKMYKWNVENLALFFFIKAQQQVFPTMTIDQGICNYRRFTGITFTEWDLDSMRTTYNRLQKEFYETAKENR
ncbi:MAG: hypothetical protein ABFC18_03150 [Rikenellaceae bacterium]